ncbi:Magnetosome protein MamE trypsin-like serine protease [Paramagnetospirillum magnetotacticum MS-1]|uniref:Magnetosome protein MamE trypsin-like serine protease n=2 Tax=Paramagnetospirillum magnetotacticum TaxID=188 RepID=A0A0C2V5Q0_PARME|nr:Magnetosome protein MamE trypsin-like serine protease [Paramagnetospirillum magnetotacticum MS-1]
MLDGDANTGGRPNAPRSKDLKRYLMLMGVVALIVLFGAFIFRQQAGGNRLGTLIRQLGHGAVTAPVLPLPANALAGAPAATGVPALPPVMEAGAAQVGGGGGFSRVVALLRHSVVSVTASSSGRAAAPKTLMPPGPDVLPRFANPTTTSVENIGTGVIVRDDGFIVTNFHVVRGANSVLVSVSDDGGATRYSAEIVKMDEALDLALLKIAPRVPLTSAVLGDSSAVRVADEVIAIGTPFGLDMSVSRGIISAKGKSMVIEGVTHSKLLQTDTAINQGNSGGPLVIADGTVIGINTAIYTPSGAFAGIGFAVPSNQVRLFVEDEVNALPAAAAAAGPAMGAVAFRAPGPGGVGAAGPAIAVGGPSPHTDGRQAMACDNCHQIIGAAAGPIAFAQPMMPVAAPPPAAPPIQANAANPHADNRRNMNCAGCHQIIGAGAGAGPVAFAQPGAGGYQFAQPPGGLAVNVQGARGGIGSRMAGHSLHGAALATLSPQMSLQTGLPVGRGVLITGVSPNTAAASAGLRPGDVLLKIDGRPVALPHEAVAIMGEMSVGGSVRLGVLRDGGVRNMTLIAGSAVGTPPSGNGPW